MIVERQFGYLAIQQNQVLSKDVLRTLLERYSRLGAPWQSASTPYQD